MSVEKAEAVSAIVIESVNQGCPECNLLPDRITDSFWRCFTESPQTATYRATVHGTVDGTSAEVLTAIEVLVRSDEPIRLLSVEYSFVSECRVEILTENEGKCQTSSASAPLLIPIVGGALGGITVFTLCVVVVIVAMVVRKRQRSQLRDDPQSKGVRS